VIYLPIRTLRLIQTGISFDYSHELRRKARRNKYGLFGEDRKKITHLSAANFEFNTGRQRAGAVRGFK
jgi:hypothetical protein